MCSGDDGAIDPHLQKGGGVRSPFVPYTMNHKAIGNAIYFVRRSLQITKDPVVWIIGRDDQGWRRTMVAVSSDGSAHPAPSSITEKRGQ